MVSANIAAVGNESAETPLGIPARSIVLPTIDQSRDAIRAALQDAVQRLDRDLRAVVAYHLGWIDVEGRAVAGSGGKLIRPGLTVLAAAAAGATLLHALPGAVAVELVHNFSLIHDDLMDRDVTRRHRPTIWSVWGDNTAMLAGDAVLSLAYEILCDCDSSHIQTAGRVLGAATRELARGQASDIDFEGRTDVTVTECIDMAMAKTGALLAASAVIGATLAGASAKTVEAFDDYGHKVGLAFQFVDDFLGIWGDPAITGKPVYSDLRARKKSLPITWALERGGPIARELSELLSAATVLDDDELTRAAELVERGGGRDWVLAEAQRQIRDAETTLEDVPIADRHRRELIDLAWFIARRRM
jgi:geranylgeranyl diphosphate synthase, type I